MPKTEKLTFEVHADKNGASVVVGDKELRLEQGKPYETSNHAEQLALSRHPFVKLAEKADTKSKGDK
jgi:hypothetical protein